GSPASTASANHRVKSSTGSAGASAGSKGGAVTLGGGTARSSSDIVRGSPLLRSGDMPWTLTPAPGRAAPPAVDLRWPGDHADPGADSRTRLAARRRAARPAGRRL